MPGEISESLCPSFCHGIVDMQGRCPHDRLADLVGKVCKLCRVKSIRIAVSAVMDELKWPYLTGASFCLRNALQRKRESCFRSTGRVRGKVDDHVKMVGKEIKRVTPILVFYVVELFEVSSSIKI